MSDSKQVSFHVLDVSHNEISHWLADPNPVALARRLRATKPTLATLWHRHHQASRSCVWPSCNFSRQHQPFMTPFQAVSLSELCLLHPHDGDDEVVNHPQLSFPIQPCAILNHAPLQHITSPPATCTGTSCLPVQLHTYLDQADWRYLPTLLPTWPLILDPLPSDPLFSFPAITHSLVAERHSHSLTSTYSLYSRDFLSFISFPFTYPIRIWSTRTLNQPPTYHLPYHTIPYPPSSSCLPSLSLSTASNYL